MATRRPAEVPDGGWGWAIVLAAFLMSALVFGVLRSFGVFFVRFVEYFSEVSSTVSWITSMAVAVQQFFSELPGCDGGPRCVWKGVVGWGPSLSV